MPRPDELPGLRRASGQRTPITQASAPPGSTAGRVLADRLAAALVQREPGWRLPRRSALARRYSVSLAEIDQAIGELIRRSLIRGLPDGQLYRASPAEYLIPVEGVAGLRTWLDPMGGEIVRQAGHVSQRAAPQDVAWALDAEREAPLRVVQCVWAAGGEPVAISTAYVPEAVACSLDGDDLDSFQAMLRWIPAGRPGGAPACAGAVDLGMAPAHPAAARTLRLAPGEPTISVTIRFDDPGTGAPAALTVVTLKPDRFRVVVETGSPLTVPGKAGHQEASLLARAAAAEPVPAAWRW